MSGASGQPRVSSGKILNFTRLHTVSMCLTSKNIETYFTNNSINNSTNNSIDNSIHNSINDSIFDYMYHSINNSLNDYNYR